MLDEPYRWTEAVDSRREYIEEQLKGGSPVVALVYEDGIVMLTLSRDQKKIFEVYDRIAYSAIGHPADVEKLRNFFIDAAHLEGFNRSVADVTLQRLVKFGVGPIIKQSFDELFRSPYIIKILMAELSYYGNGHALYSVNYDGGFKSATKFEAIAGTESAESQMKRRLRAVANPEKLKLKDAIKVALEAWAYGKRALKLGYADSKSDADTAAITAITAIADSSRPVESHNFHNSRNSTVDPKQISSEISEIDEILSEELKNSEIEAAVLQRSRLGNSKFRILDKSDISNQQSAVSKKKLITES